MSKEVMKLMNEQRTLNNEKIVNYVVLIEDQETYPKAIRNLMNRYKDIILEKGILERLKNANKDMAINQELSEYEETIDEKFIRIYLQYESKRL